MTIARLHTLLLVGGALAVRAAHADAQQPTRATRDPFRAPIRAERGAEEVAPPVPAVLTSLLAADQRSVAVFRTPANDLLVLGLGDRLGSWTLMAVTDEDVQLAARGRTRTFTQRLRVTPTTSGAGARSSDAVPGPASALPMGDIPLLPPAPFPSAPPPSRPPRPAAGSPSDRS